MTGTQKRADFSALFYTDLELVYNRAKTSTGLNGATNEHFFNLADGFGWIEFFWTYVHTVHNRMATEQTIWVVQVVQT